MESKHPFGGSVPLDSPGHLVDRREVQRCHPHEASVHPSLANLGLRRSTSKDVGRDVSRADSVCRIRAGCRLLRETATSDCELKDDLSRKAQTFTSHRLRATLTSEMGHRNVPERVIKLQGHWREDRMPEKYLRDRERLPASPRRQLTKIRTDKNSGGNTELGTGEPLTRNRHTAQHE